VYSSGLYLINLLFSWHLLNLILLKKLVVEESGYLKMAKVGR